MKIPSKITETLNGLNVPWEIIVGGKHIKIMVNNQLAGVLPKGGSSERGHRSTLNTVSQIKRIAATGQAARRA
jgi:hypothetical protein